MKPNVRDIARYIRRSLGSCCGTWVVALSQPSHNHLDLQTDLRLSVYDSSIDSIAPYDSSQKSSVSVQFQRLDLPSLHVWPLPGLLRLVDHEMSHLV